MFDFLISNAYLLPELPNRTGLKYYEIVEDDYEIELKVDWQKGKARLHTTIIDSDGFVNYADKTVKIF